MHVVVVGCGRVGSTVARELAGQGNDVVVIDREAASFARLGDDFVGRTMVGVGFDRDTLVAAGTTPDSAVMAVTSGDNSNILIARVAREELGVQRVVARIYDPRRAIIYERLGIPTVASVTWSAARAIRHVMPHQQPVEWLDPTARFALVECKVPASAAGRRVDSVESSQRRVVLLTRLGEATLPAPTQLLQEGDLLHLLVVGELTATDPFIATEGGNR